MRGLLRKILGKKDRRGGRMELDPELVGEYRGAYLARATEERFREAGQDGGTVTALLAHALEEGYVEAAVVSTTGSDPWRPRPTVATRVEELLEAAGSKYSLSPNLSALETAVGSHDSVAVVGTPCQVSAVRKLESHAYGVTDVAERVKLLIGLFCSENLTYEGLVELLKEVGVDVSSVRRMDIAAGRLTVVTSDGEERSIPASELRRYANEACGFCTDLTAEDADVSVGSTGAPDGWNVVLVRTDRGERILQSAVDAEVLEVRNVDEGDPEALERLASDKRERAESARCAVWRPYPASP